MKPQEITKEILWVDTIDWNVRNFHGHTYTNPSPRGITHNEYLISDKKSALGDTVYGSFASEMIEKINGIVQREKYNILFKSCKIVLIGIFI
ncbi:MAG: hypothetical protein NC817_00565 [Candidatus Omnitrophica bacterium]|nr:hypothetical protein [Candidatus Omnitrophota bacterium]MCM8827015.1 hypothetical protein [Candidatus Omnitrophota bacterium]